MSEVIFTWELEARAMWPFRRATPIPLPDWNFSGISDGRLELSIEPGPWLLTDGASRRDAVDLGSVTGTTATVKLHRTDEGEVQELSLTHANANPHGNQTPRFEFVIDSGVIVFCSQVSFEREHMFDKNAYPLIKAAWKACPSDPVIAITNPAGHCVGLFVHPPDGDGCYNIDRATTNGRQSVRVRFFEDESPDS